MSLRPKALLLALLAVLSAPLAPAGLRAEEVIYPSSSRFGLEPPADMIASKRFLGFERPEGGATVQIVELAPSAFAEMVQTFTDENLRGQGFNVEKRERLKVSGDADALLFTGDQPANEAQGTPAIRKWILLVGAADVTGVFVVQLAPGAETEEAIRAMLTGVKIRPPLSLEQQVEVLPFRITDLAGFHPVRVLAGNSVLLTKGPKDQLMNLDQPILVLAQAVQQPPAQEQRDGFARAALYSNQTMKDFFIERSQSYRSNGVDWHEIVARATDVPSNSPVVVSQTIRFNPDGYVRAVGIARAEQRAEALPLFRQVVDSVVVR
ncbi:hypothetical protein [Methylobacterium organophilum]|uniref:Uncharacterized protein n=1 Tax=Methylobacterium organophilum TaxID=410 RepID=A0ABQ4TCZ8_METOR|nr:hypothetical protein [Methylobacterium organophilum]GJE28374.1 hypothetical protein LKMONMHP_3245 [Methylobacterium organophilum]